VKPENLKTPAKKENKPRLSETIKKPDIKKTMTSNEFKTAKKAEIDIKASQTVKPSKSKKASMTTSTEIPDKKDKKGKSDEDYKSANRKSKPALSVSVAKNDLTKSHDKKPGKTNTDTTLPKVDKRDSKVTKGATTGPSKKPTVKSPTIKKDKTDGVQETIENVTITTTEAVEPEIVESRVTTLQEEVIKPANEEAKAITIDAEHEVANAAAEDKTTEQTNANENTNPTEITA
jgi:hypothetical protein